MEPVIGRDFEIDMVMQILCRKQKNNPALVGEPGVGKTAIAEGLAQRDVYKRQDGDVLRTAAVQSNGNCFSGGKNGLPGVSRPAFRCQYGSGQEPGQQAKA